MSAEAPVSQPGSEEHSLRRGRLGPFAIAFFVVSAVAPLTGMGGGAPFAMLLGNGPGVPATYVVVTVLMLIFAVGYVAMARHHTSTGAFYSYVARSLGGYLGGAAALIALLGYNTMQIGLYGLFGLIGSSALSLVHINISWWLTALIGWALIAVCGYRQVDLSLKVLSVLVGCEFLIVIIFDLMVLAKGGGLGGPHPTSLDFSSFSWSSFSSGAPGIGMLFAAASFVGFEATTIYSEEARDPARTVPRATYMAVITIGAFFLVTSWLMVNAYGDNKTLVPFIGGDKSVPHALATPTDLLFTISNPYIGDFLSNKVMVIFFASSLFAALLAFHNAVARYVFALGREGILPAQLGHTHKVHLSPHKGSLSQSVLALVIVGLWAITKSDPNNLFAWLTQLGTLAITFLMALSALAVLIFFVKHKGLDSRPWNTLIAPAIAFLGLLVIGVYATDQFGFLIGNPDSALAWELPALIVVSAAAGAVCAHLLRQRSPQRFAEMGRHRGEDLLPYSVEDLPLN